MDKVLVTSDLQDFTECEVTLIINSKAPQSIVNQINLLSSIGEYKLVPQVSETIHDLYFDTPDGQLQNQLLALRVRRIGTRLLITLKDRALPSDQGGVERPEIELPWSHEGLVRCIDVLIEKGIEIQHRESDFDYVCPDNVMQTQNLVIFQNRKTNRQIRHIVLNQGNSPVLAELVIDRVIYCFRDLEIQHYEIEIETKVNHPPLELRILVEDLVTMYQPVLREWPHSKVAIGKAIEMLMNEGVFKNLIGCNNSLLPTAYDKIDERLKQSKVNS